MACRARWIAAWVSGAISLWGAWAGAQERDVSYVIEQYRGALGVWLHGDERARLTQIDASATARSDAHLLQWPMALEAAVRRHDARRLRELPPVIDEGAARAVTRDALVQAALRRRMRLEVASAERWAHLVLLGDAPAAPSSPRDLRLLRAMAADRALAAAGEAVRLHDMVDVSESAEQAAEATPSDASRAIVVDAAVDLLRDMIAIARGRPIDPDTHPDLGDGVAIDPFAPFVAIARRHQPLPVDPVRSPLGPCMDDFRCLPP